MNNTQVYRKHSSINEIVIVVVSAIVLFALMFIILTTVFQQDTHSIADTETYMVQDGDTLWGIAKLSNGYNQMDIREIIHDIKELSNCTTDIRRGDIILIPIYEEE